MKMYKLAYLFLFCACTVCGSCSGGEDTNNGDKDEVNGDSSTVPTIEMQTSVLQKEKIIFALTNADELEATEWTIDFGDGQTYNGAVSESVTHAYTNTSTEGDSQTYTVKFTVGSYSEQREIEVFHLVAISEMLKMWDDEECQKVLVMTHRGHVNNQKTTENSISSVSRSIEAGADIIECDPQSTIDNVVVVSHDGWLELVTDAQPAAGEEHVNIEELTWDAVQRYNLKYRDGSISNEKIPTLRNFLLAGKGKIYYNLDYSPRTATTDQVMDVVEELGMTEQVFYYCNSEDKVNEVLDRNPNAHAYCWSNSTTMRRIMRDDPERRFMVQLDGYTGNEKSWENSRKFGFIVSANLLWVNHNDLNQYGVNETYVDALLESGVVQVIHTDDPAGLVDYLKQKGRR